MWELVIGLAYMTQTVCQSPEGALALGEAVISQNMGVFSQLFGTNECHMFNEAVPFVTEMVGGESDNMVAYGMEANGTMYYDYLSKEELLKVIANNSQGT